MHVLATGWSAVQNEVTSLQSVWQFLKDGGPVMVPIGLLSVIALGFAIERYLRLRRPAIMPDTVEEAVRLVHAGSPDQAAQMAEQIDAPAGRILAAGLRRRGFRLAEVEKAFEDQARKEQDRLRGNIRVLNFVANIAPLLGLFGTVVGIYEAFHTIVKVGMGKPEMLAGGIEVALITTIAGLIVAMPCLVLASLLNGRLRRMMLLVDETLSPVVERIALRGESDAA